MSSLLTQPQCSLQQLGQRFASSFHGGHWPLKGRQSFDQIQHHQLIGGRQSHGLQYRLASLTVHDATDPTSPLQMVGAAQLQSAAVKITGPGRERLATWIVVSGLSPL